MVQSSKWIEGNLPDSDLLEKVTVDLLKECKCDNFNNRWVVPEVFSPEFDFRPEKVKDHIRKLIPYVKVDASPGVPLSNIAPTNGQVIDHLGEQLVDMVYERIHSLCFCPNFVDCRPTSLDLVEHGLCDPVRLFIKNEPHTKAKIEEGRLRLIMSVSLVDKIIEAFFSNHMNKSEIAHWYQLPFKPGMGFTLEDHQRIYQRLKSFGFENLASADVSGWDQSVKEWMLIWDVEFRLRAQQPIAGCFERGFRNRAYVLANSVFQLSNGDLYSHPPGIQCSGSNNTSSTNSHMRSMLARLVGSTHADSNGDDCIETIVDDAIQKYMYYGFRCKMYDKIETSFEFCSHMYSEKGAYALNIIKETMNLLHHHHASPEELRDYTLQYEEDLAFNPDFPSVLNLLKGMGWYAKLNC